MTAIGTPAEVLGLNAAVEQGSQFGWSFFEGERTVLRYRGPSPLVKAIYDSFKAVAGSNPEYDTLMFDAGRGVAALEVVKVEDGEPLYELIPIESRVAIEGSDYFQTTDDDGAALEADAINFVFKQFNLAESALPDNWLDENKVSQSTTTKMTNLFEQLSRGETEKTVTTYALRETIRVSKRSTVSATHTNVDRVEVPPDVSAVNALIGTLPAGEWLRRGTSVRQIGSRRWELVTEWWYARKWSRVHYGGTLEP